MNYLEEKRKALEEYKAALNEYEKVINTLENVMRICIPIQIIALIALIIIKCYL